MESNPSQQSAPIPSVGEITRKPLALLRRNPSLLWVSITFVVLSGIVWYALDRIEWQLRQSTLNVLNTLAQTTQRGMQLWAEDKTRLAVRWTNAPTLREWLRVQLSKTHSVNELRTSTALNQIHGFMQARVATIGGDGFYFISPDGVIVAAHRHRYVGETHPLMKMDPASIARLREGETLFTSILPVQIDNDDAQEAHQTVSPSIYVGAGLRDAEGEVIAILMLRFNTTNNIEYLTLSGRMGRSGETFLIDRKGTLVSNSRFTDQLQRLGLLANGETAVFRLRASDPGEELSMQLRRTGQNAAWPLTYSAQHLRAGGSGFNAEGYRDYRGKRVLGAWVWDDRLRVGIISKMDEEEVLQPYYAARWLVVIVLAVTIGLSLIMVFTLGLFRLRSRVLSKISYLDSLTSIFNRRRFDEEIAQQWRIACRSKLPLSLIILDVDRFKEFNDRYGHPAGDSCLRMISKILRMNIRRAQDLVARYGGEEFAVLLPMTDKDSAMTVAKKIQTSVAQLAIEHADSEVSDIVTVSLGVATSFASETGSFQSLIDQADQAMYAAKHAGRNRVVQAE